MMEGMGNGMGLGMGFGGFWLLLLLVAAIVLVVWLVRTPRRNSESSRPTAGRPTAERESAVEMAERRYAKGEITREEFESIKRNVS